MRDAKLTDKVWVFGGENLLKGLKKAKSAKYPTYLRIKSLITLYLNFGPPELAELFMFITELLTKLKEQRMAIIGHPPLIQLIGTFIYFVFIA